MDADHARLTLPGTPTEPAAAWLAPWLDWLDVALHREVLRVRARYELSIDELRGLYVSDEQVDRLIERNIPSPDVLADLARLEGDRRALLANAYEVDSPLRDLARRFGLDDVGLLAIVLCLAPEVDLSYQTIYAYLNDDVTRRLPTVDLCQRLVSGTPLDTSSTIIAEGLVEVERLTSAPLWRSAGLLLAEPVRRLLLGTDPLCHNDTGGHNSTPAARVVAIEADIEEDALEAAQDLAAADGRALIQPDLSVPDPTTRLRQALLRARLHNETLYVSDLELGPDPDGRAREIMAAPVHLIVSTRPGQRDRFPLDGVDHERVVLERPDVEGRTVLWSTELGRLGLNPTPSDLSTVASLFTLSPSQIRAAAATAVRSGRADLPALTDAARLHSTAGLDAVAECVPTVFAWDDLVLPIATHQRLRELASAIRHRHQVFDTWTFGRLAGGHDSVRALFSGPSGTGKTMSAAVLAGELGLELFRVDLSAVVSKYIGETEKNLERVLKAAENSNALLLFDEADALFGKRSEVKDAHDRYANIEIAFLLQRLETFDGVLILATNLAGNLDEAFSRRIHFHVDFPMPDDTAREQLWRKAIPKAAPIADDIDWEFLAGVFPMTGGEVRSAALLAAFMAAGESTPIMMRHLVKSLARLRRQQGKLPSSAEFKG
ncbi:ATP-binding protein, partial [Rhodococcus wratislaviensis]